MYHPIRPCYNGRIERHRTLRGGAERTCPLPAVAHLRAVSPLCSGVAENSAWTLRPRRQAALCASVEPPHAIGLAATHRPALGDTVHRNLACAGRIPAQRIVLHHYYQSSISRWWNSSRALSLLERARCSMPVGSQEPPDG